MTEMITISRRALKAAIREAAAQGTDHEYTEASVLDYVEGIVDDVLPPLLAGTGSAATYDLVVNEAFFRRITLTVDAVKACEIALRSCDVVIDRTLKPSPGWIIERGGSASFISADEAVRLSVPDLVDLITERLAHDAVTRDAA